ncbi:MAG: hypothetical protein ABIB43_01900 [archaeon]
MILADIVKGAYVSILGNRVNVVGISLIIADSWMQFGPDAVEYSQFANHVINTGVIFSGLTIYGIETKASYKKVKKHIQETGSLNKEFLKKGLNKKNRIFNYCRSQGVYLAAKEFGYTKQFKEAKKLYSKSIIPNF